MFLLGEINMNKMSKVTMIMRGYTQSQVKTVAKLLSKSRYVRNLEVTMNTDNALEIIKTVSKECPQLVVGAGTVLTLNQLKEVIAAGARFVLSPTMMSEAMIKYCKEHHVISIPGAFSPSEIYQMHNMQADIIKVFPSQELSPSYAFKIKEPLPSVKLMAVGGVNKDNINEYLKGSYDYIGTAGGIFKKTDIMSENIDNLERSLKEFEDELAKAEEAQK